MAADPIKQGAGKKALQLLNIGSRYRRVARFYPALLTIALLLPAAIMLGIPLHGWLAVMTAGGGIALSAATAGLLSHLAAAAGNRIQEKIYPRWPLDSPTNTRLLPSDPGSSKQQKQKWYEAIRRLTAIDIASVVEDPEEAERAINDALVVLRSKVFHENKLAERLDMHNADYGFVRNFTGLRPVWLFTSFVSCAGCWGIYALRKDNLTFPVLASVIFVGCLLAALVLKGYVRHVARHYADSFFGALDACDELAREKEKKASKKPFTP
jgi:hypothetical protein